MKKKDNLEKIIDLICHKLSSEGSDEELSGLKESGSPDDEIESIRRISHLIEKMPVEEPSSRMDRKFYEMLEKEKNRSHATGSGFVRKGWYQSSAFTVSLRVAAGIALFLMGWFAASWFGLKSTAVKEMAELSYELKDLKGTLVLTMMNQNSSLERIKAISMVNEFENADERIIESLIGALNNDNNDNVRLLSLEALIKYSGNPSVREGLIESIPNQTSPMIQLRLAEVMVALDEKKAASEFQKVLMNTGLNYNVRNKISEAVTVLL